MDGFHCLKPAQGGAGHVRSRELEDTALLAVGVVSNFSLKTQGSKAGLQELVHQQPSPDGNFHLFTGFPLVLRSSGKPRSAPQGVLAI